ncbi:hypothetical protein OEZ85_005165 [Tetradesmus obliquus]|uniref:Protein phosphatase 1 regulatory subunit 7 n=1 Tax=Tetradesmus obliquus TaxID=3088 RepID=A0ABY8UID8_TETOB|nr:hypothetical protein OEZ85_005165 [Tetradesmus obliquus]
MADVLDLTNSHLRDLSTVEISPTLTALDLTANRLQTLDPRVVALTGLRALNLRQNIIADATGVNECCCKGALEDLELRDNLLTEIPTLEGFSQLTRLEFSYNQIRSLPPLSSLTADPAASPPLLELFVAANKVAAIEALEGLGRLTHTENSIVCTIPLLQLAFAGTLQPRFYSLFLFISLIFVQIRSLAPLSSLTADPAASPPLLELFVAANKIRSLAPLSSLTADPAASPPLLELFVAANKIRSLAPLSSLTADPAASPPLLELFVAANKIRSLAPLSSLTADPAASPPLLELFVAANKIRSLAPLSSLTADPAASPPLLELFVAANKVTAIEALGGLSKLTVLELGSNRIRTIEGLGSQACLLELWLGRNRISKIENLGHMTALRRISLQSNRLESMCGIAACSSLVELYLSHNGIWSLDQQLTQLKALRVLDVSNNRISKVEHLQGLSQLEDLWLNDNQMPSLDGIEEALKDQVDSLTTIYLEHNPAAAAPDYKQRLLALLPKLQQLDANVLPEREQT